MQAKVSKHSSEQCVVQGGGGGEGGKKGRKAWLAVDSSST